MESNILLALSLVINVGLSLVLLVLVNIIKLFITPMKVIDNTIENKKTISV